MYVPRDRLGIGGLEREGKNLYAIHILSRLIMQCVCHGLQGLMAISMSLSVCNWVLMDWSLITSRWRGYKFGDGWHYQKGGGGGKSFSQAEGGGGGQKVLG